jgi:hypothetical protein
VISYENSVRKVIGKDVEKIIVLGAGKQKALLQNRWRKAFLKKEAA